LIIGRDVDRDVSCPRCQYSMLRTLAHNACLNVAFTLTPCSLAFEFNNEYIRQTDTARRHRRHLCIVYIAAECRLRVNRLIASC